MLVVILNLASAIIMTIAAVGDASEWRWRRRQAQSTRFMRDFHDACAASCRRSAILAGMSALTFYGSTALNALAWWGS